MLSPLIPPIKTLMPVPEEDEMLKYEYFVQFNPMSYYRPYHTVMDLLVPYWHNKNEYSDEEVADLLKQVYNHLAPCIAALEHEHLINSRVGALICNWVMRIHDTLPHQFQITDWHCTIARMAPEPGLVANNEDFPGYVFNCFPMPLPGATDNEEILVFESPKKESPSTPACPQASSSSTPALLLPPQSTCPQQTPMSLVPPVANSLGVLPTLRNHPHVHALGAVLSSPASLPSPLANRWVPPLWNSFSAVKPLGLYHGPTDMAPATPSQRTTMASQSASLSCGLQDMASFIQDLRQVLLTPGSGMGLCTSEYYYKLVIPFCQSYLCHQVLLSTLWTLQPNPLLQHHQAPPLPPILRQGNFAGVCPLSPVDEAPPTPMTLPPPLPEEDQVSAFMEELPPPTNFMDVDAPPSPPRVYHLVTGTPLPSCSLVMHLPLPEASPSPCGDGIQQHERRKKKKVKGKGKAVAHSPKPSPPTVTATLADIAASSVYEAPPSLPKKVPKQKRAPEKTAPSVSGPSKSTHASVAASKSAAIPSTSNGSVAAGHAIKKPWFSLKKASKKASRKATKSATSATPQDSNQMFLGCPKQQFLATELTQAQVPDQEGIPIDRHNSRTKLEDFHFKDLITVPDKFFDPVRYSHKNGTYGAHSSRYAYYTHAPNNNWFPGANCDQCREGHHRGCSACYTTCEMHEITSHLTTFAWYNIPALRWNIMQLCGINCELEHVDYLYRGHLHARDRVVHDIAESLDQFASAEGGNELIDDLSHVYREVRSFIINNSIWHSLGLSLNLPEGPEYTPSDNNALMWDEGEDDRGEDEPVAGPSDTQGGDGKGAAEASK
ncbi:hypothetical protein ARMGADRAFT_1028978 [Armillaria gallica]|uniref:Uncharacterized protein n=1 Tax=Armillaria gallica TaxID=47427 RepID=A0A2H3E1Y3_ARMGA|nr:hypothetical protein ARMGADRAFT_1028978 [Armillaria gallica]